MRLCLSLLTSRDKRRTYSVGYYSASASFTSGFYWIVFFNLVLALLTGIASIRLTFSATNPSELSILMPIYNKAQYLNRSLGSIRNLDLTNHPTVILCLDDASTDSSVAAVQSHQLIDPRIVLYQNPKRLGTHRTRLRLASLVSTTWMVCLDPDDMFYGNGSILALEFAQASGAEIVQFGCLCWDVPNRLLALCWREPFARNATREQLLDLVFAKCADINMHRKIFRTEVVRKGIAVMPDRFRDLMLCRAEDLLQYLFIVSVMRGKWYYIPDYGEIRFHGLPNNSLTEAYEDYETRRENTAMINRFAAEFANRSWAKTTPTRGHECDAR
jgi:glycosyltransferase involved in cell wall biosynthesis